MIPQGQLGIDNVVRAWVPLDDDHTMFWTMSSVSEPGGGTATLTDLAGRALTSAERQPNTTDGLGRWRLTANRTNDHRIDRETQRTKNFSGIEGIHLQDPAITESMGVSVDRTKEHLGTTDAMVIKTRRRLIAAAKALRDHGTTPPGVDEPRLYQVRSGGSVVLPKAADWLEGTEELRLAFARRELEPATPLA